MADTKTTALTEITAPVATDLVYVVGDPGTTPVSRKATLTTIRKTLMVDGWIEAGETWTYAASDAPTYTFTISGDKTTKYSAGMRLKLTDSGVKYFIVTAVSYGAPNTTVTVYGGTDYALTGGAITLPYYSMSKSPFGFPLDVTKWTVEVTDTTDRAQASPGAGTWYNLGGMTISVPIGHWRLYYRVFLECTKVNVASIAAKCTLSTANNSESDVDFTRYGVFVGAAAGGTNQNRCDNPMSAEKFISAAAKTPYYLNADAVTATTASIDFRNDLEKMIIRAICAYL